MPEKPYDHNQIELKWHERWRDADLYKAEENSAKPKFYVLEMLPYPSGTLHIGHIRNYSIGDALARYKWMRGFNVLHPMGWDAFGLPAENAAIANHRPPREWTLENIAAMKKTHRRFAFSYDWDREVSTCEPEYYRWNQWFFLKMLERGLAYRKKALVNWCPKCATVLANEQVVEGCCWRHEDTPVEQRALEQWFLKITAYADQLLDDMRQLEGGWPERVLTMQRNWIGRSEGAEIDFKLAETGEPIRVFTTRVDTIYGATCVILAPEHPLNEQLLDDAGQARAKAMVDARAGRDPGDIEKEGFSTGHYAVNPYSGERIPIWVANFVLMGYGTGAIMAVPAHDERDFEFCRKYGIAIRPVIRPVDGALAVEPGMTEAFTEYGIVENSGPWSGLPSEEARRRMAAYAEEHGFGKAAITYRIKDWGISRQRYWGTPIPVIHCPACGVVPVPEDQLPVLLPDRVEITGAGRSPLENVPEFVNVACPKCGGAGAARDRYHGHLHRFVLVFLPLLRSAQQPAALRPRQDRLLVRDRPVHRRRGARHSAPDLLALLHQDDARHRPDPKQRAGAAPVHAGHGDRRRRQDVEVQGQRGGRGHAGREVRRRYRAHVRAVRRAAGKGSRLAHRRRRRHLPLPGPRLPLRHAQRGPARRRARRIRPQGSAQAAPDPAQDHRGFRNPLALQHLHRRHHGAGQRALRRGGQHRPGGDAEECSKSWR